jgi:hypothetical protein
VRFPSQITTQHFEPDDKKGRKKRTIGEQKRPSPLEEKRTESCFLSISFPLMTQRREKQEMPSRSKISNKG